MHAMHAWTRRVNAKQGLHLKLEKPPQNQSKTELFAHHFLTSASFSTTTVGLIKRLYQFTPNEK
jgi:hypothetical protein